MSTNEPMPEGLSGEDAEAMRNELSVDLDKHAQQVKDTEPIKLDSDGTLAKLINVSVLNWRIYQLARIELQEALADIGRTSEADLSDVLALIANKSKEQFNPALVRNDAKRILIPFLTRYSRKARRAKREDKRGDTKSKPIKINDRRG